MRHDLADIPPLRKADKLCLAVLAGAFLVQHLACWAMDSAASRAAEPDKPPATAVTAPDIDWTPLLEAVEARREELFWASVPLDQNCREALQEACEAHNVPLCLALGLIEVESGFQVDAVSVQGAYGLCQLNPKYFPEGLTPCENIGAGVRYLGELMRRYETVESALTVYNAGSDTGDRTYANAVLAAAEWGPR